MPFKKVGDNNYTSPSGRHFNGAQVRLYYANGGHFPGEKYGEGGMIKGHKPVDMAYAAGGPVLGRTRDFMKIKDEFRDPDERNPNADEDNKYGKSGDGAGTGFVKPGAAKDKSLKAVKPRK